LPRRRRAPQRPRLDPIPENDSRFVDNDPGKEDKSMRMTRTGLIGFVLAAVCVGLASAQAPTTQRPTTQAPGTLSAADRSAIQQLVADYARYLADCRAEQFADLFAADGGYFASGFRGHMVGRDKLVELVESERHCLAPPNSTEANRPGGGNAPPVEIETDGGVVRGVAALGFAEYQDEYTKTPAGWRFAARTVLTAAEKEAGLDAAALLAIQRLGGDALGDNYEADDSGTPRLMTSGVQVNVADGKITGRAYLAGGGYRDEVYEQDRSGQWRVKSSTYVPPAGD
jgi:hypothetical protein